jgi:hypothetical protein
MSGVNNGNASFDDGEPKKFGTRVFKKSSPNGKVNEK